MSDCLVLNIITSYKRHLVIERDITAKGSGRMEYCNTITFSILYTSEVADNLLYEVISPCFNALDHIL